jgi:hypothetical protein
MDFGVSKYESWLCQQLNKLKKLILMLESFIASHGLKPHQVTAATKRTNRISESDVDRNDVGSYEADELARASKNDFVTIECACAYGKWYSEQLLEFIYTAINWTLQQYDFATMLDDINNCTMGRIETWTKRTEYVSWGPAPERKVATVLGEELVYVIEDGLIEGPLLASRFVRDNEGGMKEAHKAVTATISRSGQNHDFYSGVSSSQTSAKHTKGVQDPELETISSEQTPNRDMGSSSETEEAGTGRTTELELSPGLTKAAKFGVRYQGRR